MASVSYAINPVQVQEVARVQRINRRPSHQFQLRVRPWQLQPCVMAPVLPGETMENALIQYRAVTDPVKNPLVGWWSEFYLFYVKLSDLDDFDQYIAPMLVAGVDASDLNSGPSAAFYHPGGSINWAKLCLDRIVATYFRDEDETIAREIDGLPLQRHGNVNWTQSLIHDGAEFDSGELMPGENPQLPDNLASEFQLHYEQWMAMRSMKLTEATFEDWLKTFGIRVPKSDERPRRPELLRYVREWTYPSNTIDPTDGSPSSAISWAVAERADKNRFFQHPGFLVGVTCHRPKVYMGNLKGGGFSMLDQPLSWMPGFLQDAPYTSLRKYAAGTGPVKGASADPVDYWVDMRDLFIHGDQFVNYVPDAASSLVSSPLESASGTFDSLYPSASDLDALFVSAASNKIKIDGRVDFTIKGTQRDTSL